MASDSLEKFVETVNGTSHLRIEQDFGDGFVRLRTSEAERRQAAQDIKCSEDIVLELLRNSRDAHATQIFIATTHDGGKRILTAIDNGDGMPESMHELVFEPRVTSKLDSSHKDKWGLHGRGMALFSIRENAVSAQVKKSKPTCGTAIEVVTETSKLPEKTDQSTFPTFSLQENGQVSVRGPRNIVRTACEFAIEERNSCSIYVGSPTEILAALVSFGRSSLSSIERAFCDDLEELALCKRPATAADPHELAAIAHTLGLDISERSARRVLDGEIQPALPLLERIVINNPASDKRPKPRKRAKAGAQVKIGRVDLDSFKEVVEDAWKPLAQRYYLEEDVDASIRVSKKGVTITLPIAPKD